MVSGKFRRAWKYLGKSAAGDRGSVGRLLSERRPWKFYPDRNPADCRRTGGRRDV